MRFAQLVMGPAGSGKSTYCSNLVQHAQDARRTISVVNLDPAAEQFNYEVMIDIREFIQLDDVMEDEELTYGPNGGLIFCMEYFLDNIETFKEQLEDGSDDYILFDCPGQIELYTHMNVMNRLIELLQSWNFRVCAVFLLDSQFMVETSKFFSGTLTALSAMVNLEVPQVNVLTKIDLLSKKSKKQLERFLEADTHMILEDERLTTNSKWEEKYFNLSLKIGQIVDDFSMVTYIPLDVTKEESFHELLQMIDSKIQFGEDDEVKVMDFDEISPEDEGFNE